MPGLSGLSGLSLSKHPLNSACRSRKSNVDLDHGLCGSYLERRQRHIPARYEIPLTTPNGWKLKDKLLEHDHDHSSASEHPAGAAAENSINLSAIAQDVSATLLPHRLKMMLIPIRQRTLIKIIVIQQPKPGGRAMILV